MMKKRNNRVKRKPKEPEYDPRTFRCKIFGCKFEGIGYHVQGLLGITSEIECCTRCDRGRIFRFPFGAEYYTPKAVNEHIALVESQNDKDTNVVLISGKENQ